MSHVGAYVALMKLRVVELLLVTTLPALFMATYAQNHAHHFPPLGVTIATLIGGTLAAGASNAFNMVIEVDSDRLMKRTEKRPLVSGEITKQQAVAFSLMLTIFFISDFLDLYYCVSNVSDIACNISLCCWIYSVAKTAHIPKYCVGWYRRLHASTHWLGCNH